MCCFSQPVERVSGTRIFARSARDALQYLVYSMNLAAAGDLAMLLPLPVPPRSREDAVRFLNLEHFADFFDDLERPFLPPPTRSLGAPQAPLKVHDVGAFEASFVPAISDFGRLDARFRLPQSAWDALPAYRDHGFAVFKLKSPGPKPGLLQKILGGTPQRAFHPMAFEFPRRDPTTLFFPTLHIHDGCAHERADFDHVLYCQADRHIERALAGWREAPGPVKGYTRGNDALGILDPDAPVWRLALTGMRKNQDIVLGGTHAEAA